MATALHLWQGTVCGPFVCCCSISSTGVLQSVLFVFSRSCEDVRVVSFPGANLFLCMLPCCNCVVARVPFLPSIPALLANSSEQAM